MKKLILTLTASLAIAGAETPDLKRLCDFIPVIYAAIERCVSAQSCEAVCLDAKSALKQHASQLADTDAGQVAEDLIDEFNCSIKDGDADILDMMDLKLVLLGTTNILNRRICGSNQTDKASEEVDNTDSADATNDVINNDDVNQEADT